jgi:NAD(P)-dependent dehydrogenase (short-subunit alcohol dehydrogenase family)
VAQRLLPPSAPRVTVRLMDHPDFRLDGKVAIITGATRGIGRGLAVAMADAGATIAAAGRDEALLGEVVTEIESAGGTAAAFPLDVSDVPSIEPTFTQVRERFGSLDILVNNAGLGANHPAVDVTEADWDEMMDVNLRGLFFCCRAAGRIMLEVGQGRIVTMSSQAGMVGIREHAVYSASKGGVNLLTKVLALEWSASGVTVNAVAPTFIHTPGTAERLDDPDYLQGVLDRLPIGHVGTMTDVAAAVIYLASPAGGMVSGHVLVVDGGWTAQ